jgi:hypothetical protein
VICNHGGTVTLVPRQENVTIQGGAVMCEPDLVGSVIVGCAQPPTPSTKPCTTVVATFPGSTSTTVSVEGRPVYLATLSGITDGVPPGTLITTDPGQKSVEAS